jgi:hypothetical protein
MCTQHRCLRPSWPPNASKQSLRTQAAAGLCTRAAEHRARVDSATARAGRAGFGLGQAGALLCCAVLCCAVLGWACSSCPTTHRAGAAPPPRASPSSCRCCCWGLGGGGRALGRARSALSSISCKASGASAAPSGRPNTALAACCSKPVASRSMACLRVLQAGQGRAGIECGGLAAVVTGSCSTKL